MMYSLLFKTKLQRLSQSLFGKFLRLAEIILQKFILTPVNDLALLQRFILDRTSFLGRRRHIVILEACFTRFIPVAMLEAVILFY